MESKGRRASRAGPSAPPVEGVTPAETLPTAAKQVESTAGEFMPAAAPPEDVVPAAAPPEDVVPAAAPPPGDAVVQAAPEPAARRAGIATAVAARVPPTDEFSDLGREAVSAL